MLLLHLTSRSLKSDSRARESVWVCHKNGPGCWPWKYRFVIWNTSLTVKEYERNTSLIAWSVVNMTLHLYQQFMFLLQYISFYEIKWKWKCSIDSRLNFFQEAKIWIFQNIVGQLSSCKLETKNFTDFLSWQILVTKMELSSQLT